MKQVTVEDSLQDPCAFCDASQGERIMVTKDGKPMVLLLGMEDEDREDPEYEFSSHFWTSFEAARRESRSRLDEVLRETERDEAQAS